MTGMETAAVRALPALISPVAWLYRRWRPEKHPRALAQRADNLAAAVDRAEDKLQQELRAKTGSFMPVTFIAADHPQSGEVIDSAEVDDISTYFDLLESPRRMVVLGDPGAGKTVAATYLVRGLIHRRREQLPDSSRAAEPVPVRVNTAGWDGAQQFSAWLVTRLNLDHRLPNALGTEMVGSGMILPVLDGLDEMDDDTTGRKRARALLDRLNEREWAHRPVVVLCRSTEFDHLKQAGGDNGLHGAATVTLAPLSPGQPADHLTRYQRRIGATHPAWDQITTHLREHTDPERTLTPLTATLRNPWMLGLTAHTLHHSPATAAALLDCPTPEAARNELFAAQIPAAIASTDDIERFRDYTPDNVEKWLRTLALHLEHRRDTGRNGTAIRLDEIWEIAGRTRIQRLSALTVTITTALALALALGLEGGFSLQSMPVFPGILTVVLASMLMATLMATLAGEHIVELAGAHQSSSSTGRIAWSVPTRTRWRGGLRSGLTAGFLFGPVSGLAVGLAVGLTAGLTAGLAVGLMAGLMVGFMAGLETNAEDQLAIGADARRLIRDDLQAALFRGALFGLAVGLMVGIEHGLVHGLTVGLVHGLTVGLAFGLAFGLIVGIASRRFFLAVLLFKITADFPGRPAAFLDWARNSGLLRVNATAYQFRHQTYQQWLLHHPGRIAPDTA
ncbi:NACHT domain-containing protein [Nocardia fusca]|uniref:NACHT domain-containing protein n=1 Tax=Nocardia fusca TaxID=941183 RepID=A0ABV3FJW5_9NOCA